MFNSDLLEFIQKNWGIYGLVLLILIGFILYIPKFIDSLGYFKLLKIRYLNEALDSNYIDEVSKKLLSENLASIYFAKCTGIRANEEERQYILDLYKILKGKLNINEIYYAVQYIPNYPHLLSASALIETQSKLRKLLKSSNYTLPLNIIATIVSFLYFFYFSAEAYYQNSFFTYEYLNTGFMAGFGFIMSITTYLSAITSVRRIGIAKDIIEYIQEISGEN